MANLWVIWTEYYDGLEEVNGWDIQGVFNFPDGTDGVTVRTFAKEKFGRNAEAESVGSVRDVRLQFVEVLAEVDDVA